jgi:hypothetical protein
LQDGRIAVILEKEFTEPINKKNFVVGINVGSCTPAMIVVEETK